MNEERALLEEILAHPDDDAPRLVYADLLTARGDPRGEFIALQCRLAATPDDDARRKMRIAENKLLKEHGATWAAELLQALPAPRPPLGLPPRYEFRRGFVEFVQTTLDVLDRLETVFAAAPLLRQLRVDAYWEGEGGFTPPTLEGRFESPLLAHLDTLHLQVGGAGARATRALGACPHLRNLRSLLLTASMYDLGVPGEEVTLDGEGVAALVDSPHLTGLRELYVGANGIGLAGVQALARARFRLERLGIGSTRLDDDALVALSEIESLAELRFLGLDHSRIGARGVRALAASATLRSLEAIDFESCQLGGAGVAAFLDALALPKLRSLRLERNSLGDAGALALAGCAALRDLTGLEMGHNRIGKKGGAALAGSPHLAKLERLLLNEPRWKADTEALFARSETLAECTIYLRGKRLARDKPKARR